MYFAATPPIHGFRPAGQPSAVQIRSSRICRARTSCVQNRSQRFCRTSYRFSFLPLSSVYAHLHQRSINGWAGRITPGFLPSALRAALRAFKFAPGKFVEPLIGSHFYHSHPYTLIYISAYIWLGREDYSVHPCTRPSGCTSCVQIRSRRICRTSYRFSFLPLSAIYAHLYQRLYMAGPGGFEPPNARIKTWCLTTWRRPNITRILLHLAATSWHSDGSCQDPMIINSAGALPLGDGPIYLNLLALAEHPGIRRFMPGSHDH